MLSLINIYSASSRIRIEHVTNRLYDLLYPYGLIYISYNGQIRIIIWIIAFGGTAA